MALRADRVGVREDQVDIHGRVTSPSFLNELLDDLPEWTDMPVWVNGTEELLPSNNSVPVTSPILADIAYPDIRRDNQYFTYRESPTPVDGLAKIKSIKGNTLRWNQLLNPMAFTYWAAVNSTVVFTDGVGTFTSNSVSAYGGQLRSSYRFSVIGHKYLFIISAMCSANNTLRYGFRNIYNEEVLSANIRKTISIIQTATTVDENIIFYAATGEEGQTLEISNIMCFDLTEMGLDSITNPAEFISLFPLPYYAYNTGILLSFNGTGLKTACKNFINADLEVLKTRNTIGTWNGNEYTYQGITFKINFTSEGYIDSIVVNGTATANANLNLLRFLRPSTFLNRPITMSGCPTGGSSTKYRMTLQLQTSPYTNVGHDTGNGVNLTIPDNGEDYQAIIRIFNGYTCDNLVFRPMITLQGADQTYEPYTSQTTNLPVATYFPTGMKSAGNVYDELKPSKAITRLKATTFTSVSAFDSSGKLGVLGEVSDAVDITTGASTMPNDKAVFETYSLSELRNNDVNGITQYGKYFYVRLQGKTTLEEYNTYLSANPLVVIYELATPVELPTMSFE